MNELLAGYASYSSTEAIVTEQQVTAFAEVEPNTSLTVTVSASASWSVTFTWTV